MISCDSPNLVFLQISQREHGFGEGVGTDGVQEIALVLVQVSGLKQQGLAVYLRRTCIVAGRKQFTAKALRMLSEYAELYLTVAQDIGIGGPSRGILVEEKLEYPVPVLFGEIDVVQRDVELLADVAGVLQVGGGRAVAVFVLPIRHVQRVHLGASLFEKYGGNG